MWFEKRQIGNSESASLHGPRVLALDNKQTKQLYRPSIFWENVYKSVWLLTEGTPGESEVYIEDIREE